MRKENLDTQRDTRVIYAQRKEHLKTQKEDYLHAKKRDLGRNQPLEETKLIPRELSISGNMRINSVVKPPGLFYFVIMVSLGN